MLDIGSNIGTCALNMAAVGYNVLAFEPVERNAAHIRAAVRRNVDISGQITLFEVGLSDKHHSATIYREIGNAGNSIVGKDDKQTRGDLQGTGEWK